MLIVACFFSLIKGHYGEDPKKDKKRREIAVRLGREMGDKRDL